MILQTAPELHTRPDIRKGGCYFMSIAFLVNKHKNITMTTEKLIHKWDELVTDMYMDSDGYIKDPNKVFSYLGMKVLYTDRHEAPERACEDDEIEILMFQVPGDEEVHFVAGNGLGICTYDSWGNSRIVRDGYLVNKRIFKIL
jgi:hypothetical protein|tara:strand:- start:866 stop:1294 length:429 start_codon:yes stop_codon:yes gene_type:complete